MQNQTQNQIGTKQSIKTDLQIIEEVFQKLSNKGSQFGRLEPKDAKKLEEQIPELERAEGLAIEMEENMLERRMNKILGIIENIDGRKMRATSQEREIQDVNWALEIVQTAQKEI